MHKKRVRRTLAGLAIARAAFAEDMAESACRLASPRYCPPRQRKTLPCPSACSWL